MNRARRGKKPIEIQKEGKKLHDIGPGKGNKLRVCAGVWVCVCVCLCLGVSA